MWLKSPKGLNRKNSYVAYVFRRVQNSRHTKLCLNRLWVKELIVLVCLVCKPMYKQQGSLSSIPLKMTSFWDIAP
jgi:hypothetical protein